MQNDIVCQQQGSIVPDIEAQSSDISLKIEDFPFRDRDKLWELSSGLLACVRKYMIHRVPENEIKEKIVSENSVPNNSEGTPSIETCIKERLIENKKSLTLTHYDSLKCIYNKIGHVFGPLLKL